MFQFFRHCLFLGVMLCPKYHMFPRDSPLECGFIQLDVRSQDSLLVLRFKVLFLLVVILDKSQELDGVSGTWPRHVWALLVV